MKSAALLARITVEPGKMGGKPVIRGRRVTPSMVLNMLANGATRDDVLEAYPVLEQEDIDACLLYAARGLRAMAEGDGPGSTFVTRSVDLGLPRLSLDDVAEGLSAAEGESFH
jgi:uncharacterized protein (DUF433 family)